MRIPTVLLADSANISRDGKLNVCGVFDQVMSTDFPMAYPLMDIALQIEVAPEDMGNAHPIAIQLRGPDGKVLLEIAGQFVANGESDSTTLVPNVLRLSNVQLPTPGKYRFDVIVANEVQASSDLTVRKVNSAA